MKSKMVCKHNFVYTQGHFYCTKCGKRNYSTGTQRIKRNKNKAIIPVILIPIVVIMMLFLFVDLDFSSIPFSEKQSTSKEPSQAKSTFTLLSTLDSQDSVKISDCMMRSNTVNRVVLYCGDFGNGEFETKSPIKSTIVNQAEITQNNGLYSVSFPSNSGQIQTFALLVYKDSSSDTTTIKIPDIEIPENIIPKLELPKINFEEFVTEPIKLPDIEFPDLNFKPTPTSVEESMKNIEYINQIRQEKGRQPISFDKRAYDLALARVQDIIEYDYFDHTNPITGSCPDSMKNLYGFASRELPAENLASGIYSANSAVDLWMTSQGHRYNLLYNDHKSGATVCLSGTCAFLGVNTQGLGKGCYTGQEGKAWQESLGKCDDDDFLRLDKLNEEYSKFPPEISDPTQYQRAMDLHNQITNFKC